MRAGRRRLLEPRRHRRPSAPTDGRDPDPRPAPPERKRPPRQGAQADRINKILPPRPAKRSTAAAPSSSNPSSRTPNTPAGSTASPAAARTPSTRVAADRRHPQPAQTPPLPAPTRPTRVTRRPSTQPRARGRSGSPQPASPPARQTPATAQPDRPRPRPAAGNSNSRLTQQPLSPNNFALARPSRRHPRCAAVIGVRDQQVMRVHESGVGVLSTNNSALASPVICAAGGGVREGSQST